MVSGYSDYSNASAQQNVRTPLTGADTSRSNVSVGGKVRSIFPQIRDYFVKAGETQHARSLANLSLSAQYKISKKLDASPIAYKCLTTLGLKEKDPSLEKKFDNQRMEEKLTKITKRLSTSFEGYTHSMGNIPGSKTYYNEHISVGLSQLRGILKDPRLSSEKAQTDLLRQLYNDVLSKPPDTDNESIKKEWGIVSEELFATGKALITLHDVKDNLAYSFDGSISQHKEDMQRLSFPLGIPPKVDNESIKKEWDEVKETVKNSLDALKTLTEVQNFIHGESKLTGDDKEKLEELCEAMNRPLDNTSFEVQTKWKEIKENLVDNMIINRVSSLLQSESLSPEESIELVGLHSVMGMFSDETFSEEKRIQWNTLKEGVETVAQQGGWFEA